MRLVDFDKYFSDLYVLNDAKIVHDRVESGFLVKIEDSSVSIPVVDYILRLTPEEEYASNFGLQWNTFKSTQLDSFSGFGLTANRLWENTKWTPGEIKGKTVLEIGSGAGRFTEILLNAGADVVSIDMSSAVNVNFKNNNNKGNLLLIQCDLDKNPLPDGMFDFVLFYGVLQHTKNPKRSLRQALKKLKTGGVGRLSVDNYFKFRLPSVWSTPKYLWRPITKRMQPQTLLRVVSFYIPYWIKIDTFIRKIPFFGVRLLSIIPIPCWNYIDHGLSDQQRVEWAIMDTFDALGARYDEPMSLAELEGMVGELPEACVDEVFLGSNGVVANIRVK